MTHAPLNPLRRTEKGETLIVGIDLPSTPDVLTAISSAEKAGYARYYAPLNHPRYKREFIDQVIVESRGDNFSRSIMAVYPQNYHSCSICKVSDLINVDSEDLGIRKNSELVLDQEMKWSIRLGVMTIMLALPVEGPFVNLARAVYSLLQTDIPPTFLIRVAMVSTKCVSYGYRSEEAIVDDSWSRWNAFRSYCSFHSKLKVALDVPMDLPSKEKIDRWLGEPIGCAIFKAKTFFIDNLGSARLYYRHQFLVLKFLRRRIQIVISGARRESIRPLYQLCLNRLWNQNEKYCFRPYGVENWEDCLRPPLQPLMNDVNRFAYRILEKDPVKYCLYERAIRKALIDRKNNDPGKKPIVVMVLSVGRGPIVLTAVSASLRLQMKIKIYAIERDPYALSVLQTQKLKTWKDYVTIVAADMPNWKAPEKADIIVSELLGAFGDNELAPECLDRAQTFLKDDGIIIPSRCDSFICPTQTHKIHSQISYFCCRKPYRERYEQPYEVFPRTAYHIAPAQKLFAFTHPNRDVPIDNTRFKTLTFIAEQDSVIHGFSGFFDAVLYKAVTMSIVPETYSKRMVSWFPIFFPIQNPVQVKKGDKIDITVWRLSNETIVWYEWLISSPVASHIHNPNGRTSFSGRAQLRF